MKKNVPQHKTKVGASTVYQVVRTTDGRTYRVPEHKAKRFLARMEGRTETVARHKARSMTRNQWSHSPYSED